MGVVVILIFMAIVEATLLIIFHRCRISRLRLDCQTRIGGTTIGWVEKRRGMCKMGVAATAIYRIMMAASRSHINIVVSSDLEINFRMN